MNRVFRILLACLFLYTGGAPLLGQDFKFDNRVQLPSADAWNFVRYGEVKAGLYTGTARLSLPVYTYKDNDFEIPISLDYSSNGNQPNTRAGILGPGWMLNAGGCITTEIRGIADYSQNYKQIRGFKTLSDNTLYTQDITRLWRYIFLLDGGVGPGAPSPGILYCPNGPTPVPDDKYDAEPDLFHFNFMGYSGTFNLDYNREIRVYNTNVNKNDIKIEIHPRALENPDLCCFSSIRISTGDGYQYLFDCNTLDSPNLDLQFVTGAGYKQITAWRLSRITAPNGRKVNFHYERYSGESYYPGASLYMGSIEQNQPPVSGSEQHDSPAYFPEQIQHEFQVNKSDYRTGLLTCIEVENGPRINFSYTLVPYAQSDQYSKNLTALMDAFGNCMRLSGIQVLRNPQDILRNATLAYRANTNGARTNYLSSVRISGEGTYSMEYRHWNDHSFPYPPNGTLSVDHWGYYNGKNNTNCTSVPYFPVSILDENLDESITGSSRDADGNYAACGLLEKITYPTGGYTQLAYEPHTYSRSILRISKYAFQPVLRAVAGTAGGVRIKTVGNYLSNGVNIHTKTYEYSNSEGGSTGILLYSPRYKIKYAASIFGGTVLEYATYHSSNLFSYNTPHIEYAHVIEKDSDGSKIKYTYTNSGTSGAYMDLLALAGTVKEPFLGNSGGIATWDINPLYKDIHRVVAPLTSHQADRGKLLEKNVYKSYDSYTPILTEQYSYDTSGLLSSQSLPCYLIRRFGYYLSFVENYKQTGIFTTQYSNENRIGVTSGTEFTYNDRGRISGKRVTDSKGVTSITRYAYLDDLSSQQINASAVYQAMQQQHIVSYPLSEKVYQQSASGTEVLLSGKAVTYALFSGIVRPSRIDLYDRSSDSWYTDISHTAYDNRGNLLESADRNGIKTSYVWGYSGLYPVCKAENSPLAQLTAVTGTTAPLAGGLSPAQKDALRSNNPGALMSFYDYSPFVGMTCLTDPSGKQTTYSYTAGGKLQSVSEAGLPQKRYEYSTGN